MRERGGMSGKKPDPADPAPKKARVDYPCVEGGIWTPIPRPPPRGSELRLKLKEVDAKESQAIKKRGVVTFHAVGCSGCFEDPKPGRTVARAMAEQAAKPEIFGGDGKAGAASFFYHLGDVVYKADAPPGSAPGESVGKEQDRLYAKQFFAQYEDYRPNIFAVPGNHDAKNKKSDNRSAIVHFLENFCDTKRRRTPDSDNSRRETMIQPYPYWMLETAVAYIIGLATNAANGGQLDDPMGSREPQYEWLLATLRTVKKENAARIAKKANPKAVLLALHYPPFSGTANFTQRGNPNLGPTPRPSPRTGTLLPLGTTLHQAFHDSQQYPDAVLSAHAHLYQRITYRIANHREIPYLVAGCGGHGPLEKLDENCWEKKIPARTAPFDVVRPPGLVIPASDRAQVVYGNDTDFGFLRLTIDLPGRALIGEFFAVPMDKGRSPSRKDYFVLDLDKHMLR